MNTFFFFSSRRRHTRYWRDWSSDVCSSDLVGARALRGGGHRRRTHGRGGGLLEQLRRHVVRVHPEFLRHVAGDGKQQIGRASCRERVKISVVAVSLKKKITKKSI